MGRRALTEKKKVLAWWMRGKKETGEWIVVFEG